MTCVAQLLHLDALSNPVSHAHAPLKSGRPLPWQLRLRENRQSAPAALSSAHGRQYAVASPSIVRPLHSRVSVTSHFLPE